jgi:flagellar biosynthesis GTPase FlhF
MCNPRRIRINVNRRIQGAWRDTIQQCAQASEQVTELARIETSIHFDDELAGPALAMLERVLAGEFDGFQAWERVDGELRLNMGEVTLIYDTRSYILSIETALTESISAEVAAAAQVSGVAVGSVAVEAVGRYYSDGWGGRTRERAKKEAQEEAEKKLAEAINQLRREQNRESFEIAEKQAREEAEQKLQARMEELRSETRAAIRERLQMTLSQAQDKVQQLVSRAIGEAYRQTLLQLVRETGGRVVTDEQTGSVINMELVLN